MSDELKKAAAPKADPAPEKPAVVAADPNAFSEEDIAQLRAKAREKVQKELRQAALKAKMEEIEEEERVAAGLAPKEGPAPTAEELLQHVTVSLPPFCIDGINLDGRKYMHGHTYRVSPAVYATLIDQMQMSWQHEDQKDGKFTNFNRRERDTHIRHGAALNAPMALNTRTDLH
jgi:hypothetical protein